ncbi:hypothetical protein D5S17_00255 [Pseudonocardiaceae bacterium YIM PH 21723]|nr:hypothetical protein D5S17_00255 [Pseudonocardiaceae bacterium YIM PH 21723]
MGLVAPLTACGGAELPTGSEATLSTARVAKRVSPEVWTATVCESLDDYRDSMLMSTAQLAAASPEGGAAKKKIMLRLLNELEAVYQHGGDQLNTVGPPALDGGEKLQRALRHEIDEAILALQDLRRTVQGVADAEPTLDEKLAQIRTRAEDEGFLRLAAFLLNNEQLRPAYDAAPECDKARKQQASRTPEPAPEAKEDA